MKAGPKKEGEKDIQDLGTRIFLAICIIVSAFLFSSCANHLKYPRTWPELIPFEENKCPDISGEYHNSGNDALGNSILLSELLQFVEKDWFNDYYLADPRINFVQILQLNNGDVEVFALQWAGDVVLVVAKKIYLKSEYDCTLEGVKIPYKVGVNEYQKTVGLIGSVSGSLYLKKSIDGSLIIKEMGTAFNVELGLPSFGKYTTWNRFLKRR